MTLGTFVLIAHGYDEWSVEASVLFGGWSGVVGGEVGRSLLGISTRKAGLGSPWVTSAPPDHLIPHEWGLCLASKFVCLLLFYVHATSKVIAEWVATCEGAHSWRLYSAAPLINQATSNMTWYLTKSHYSDTEPTSHCRILIMQKHLTRKWQVSILKSLVWLDQVSKPLTLNLNLRSSYSPISQNGRWALYSFNHSNWSIYIYIWYIYNMYIT